MESMVISYPFFNIMASFFQDPSLNKIQPLRLCLATRKYNLVIEITSPITRVFCTSSNWLIKELYCDNAQRGQANTQTLAKPFDVFRFIGAPKNVMKLIHKINFN